MRFAAPMIFATVIASGMGAVQAAWGQVSGDERQALIAFYQSTGGDDWHHNQGWLGEPGTECEWQNVFCHQGHVAIINLPGNNLTGNLPAALADLEYLEYLNLNGNSLAGSLPEGLAELDELSLLGLQGSDFGGEILSTITSMDALVSLDLGHNPLGGTLDPGLFELENLRRLWLNGTQLSGGFPPELFQATDLLGLWLHDNALESDLPADFGNLESLQYLYLGNNNLTGEIPAVLTDLPLLELDLGGNSLVGTAPESLADLTDLRLLQLHDNELQGEPAHWPDDGMIGSAFSQLEYLRLENNDFTGPYPEWIANSPELKVIHLQGNDLAGPLPSVVAYEPPQLWWNQSPIRRFNVSGNTGLTGQLPDWFTYRAGLGWLLADFRFDFDDTGVLPPDCGGVRRLPLYEGPDGLVEVDSYIPGQPRPVLLHLVPRTDMEEFSLADTVPQNWTLPEDPDCYCISGSPETLTSSELPAGIILGVQYYAIPPAHPGLADGGHFSGTISYPDNNLPDQILCGADTPMAPPYFWDRFED